MKELSDLPYDEMCLEFLKRHRMRITIRRRKRSSKEHLCHNWSFRITKSNGKFLASHFHTSNGLRPTFYDIRSSLSCDMITEEDFYEKEEWQGRLKKFFATKKVREDLFLFV